MEKAYIFIKSMDNYIKDLSPGNLRDKEVLIYKGELMALRYVDAISKQEYKDKMHELEMKYGK